MPIRTILAFCFLAACGGKNPKPATTAAAEGCPQPVPAAVTKAFPDATQGPCESETEDGTTIFEIKIKKSDGTSAEIELSPDGTIIATEEVVAAMPDGVAKAFAAKYPGATASRIEKITSPGKPATFEVKFGGKEATFSETGDFVEEEKGEADDKDGKEEKDDD